MGDRIRALSRSPLSSTLDFGVDPWRSVFERRLLPAAGPGLGLATVVGCGPTIEDESHPIGPPVDLGTVRKGDSPPAHADRLKEQIAELRKSQGKPGASPRGSPSHQALIS